MAEGYTVTRQFQTQRVNESGAVEDGFEVEFRTSAGTVGRVFVPLVQYAPEFVRSAIEDMVARIDAVAQL